MRNGYFQIVGIAGGTGLKLYSPLDGGEPVDVSEIIEYLRIQDIMYDLKELSRGVQEANQGKDVTVPMNRPQYIPIREFCALSVDAEHMTVAARFYPASEAGERMSPRELLSDLSFKNVTFGIDMEAMDAFFKNPRYCTDIVVAVGKEPRHGKDAIIEYYFNTDLKARPTLLEDGSVDFFHLNTINVCHKGDILARLLPEDKGSYGYSVYGEKIKPREVKHNSLKYGLNITLSEDRQTLISQVDGHVTLVDDKVFVSDVLNVENVDNSTGNIEYEGSVEISGNVCTNFMVKAKGNINVRGVVEGAYLEAGGDIIIARGMNGMGRGRLSAGGNIVAKFLENTRAVAHGYVSSESMLHCDVSAGTEITVTGKHGFITGGHVCASSLVQAKTLGSSMGADTIVEVGVNPGIKIRIQELQKLIVENSKELRSMQPVLEATTQKLSQGIKLRPEQMKYLQTLAVSCKEKKEALKKDNEEMLELQEVLADCATAQVVVTGEVYGGTKICISDVSMIVKNSMKYCRFIKSQGDVKMTAL